MNLTILCLVIFFGMVTTFPQINLMLQKTARPTLPKPRTYSSNCRFGLVWGNFRKTCTTPETQLKANKPLVVDEENR